MSEGPHVPVLTDIVAAEPKARPALDPASLEALARDLERTVLALLAPEVERLIDRAFHGVRAELSLSVSQLVREAVAASVARALAMPDTK